MCQLNAAVSFTESQRVDKIAHAFTGCSIYPLLIGVHNLAKRFTHSANGAPYRFCLIHYAKEGGLLPAEHLDAW